VAAAVAEKGSMDTDDVRVVKDSLEERAHPF